MSSAGVPDGGFGIFAVVFRKAHPGKVQIIALKNDVAGRLWHISEGTIRLFPMAA